MTIKKSINVNGITLSYLEINPGKEKSLVFIHGNSLNGELFKPMLESNELKEYHLLAFDFPGHGESEKSSQPEKDYNLDSIKAIIVNFIHSLKLTNVTLLGHSFGGHLSIHALSQLKNEVKGIVLFGTPPLSSMADAASAFNSVPEMAITFMSSLTDQQCRQLALVFGNSKHTEKLISAIRQSDPYFREVLGKDLAVAKYPDEIAILKSFPGKILLMHGENDKLVNPDYISKLKIENLYLQRIHIIPKASHMCFLDNPDNFLRTVHDYLLNSASQ